MRDRIAAEAIANRVLMSRSPTTPMLTLLVVEGDDDTKLYSKLTDKERCRVQPAYGKPQLHETMAVLAKRQAQGVAAIIDADFEHIDGLAPRTSNIFVTDYHDAECMLIASPALDEVLDEYGKPEIKPADIRARLFESARIMGQCRLASNRRCWKLKFDGLDYESFVDPKSMMLNAQNMVRAIRGHQGRQRNTITPPLESEITEAMENVRAERLPDPQLCNGHDLQALLSLGLRTAWGKNNDSDVSAARIASALRLAFNDIYFRDTNLHAALRTWENTNTPYYIFRSYHK